MGALDRKTLENESLNEDTKREKQRRAFFFTFGSLFENMDHIPIRGNME